MLVYLINLHQFSLWDKKSRGDPVYGGREVRGPGGNRYPGDLYAWRVLKTRRVHLKMGIKRETGEKYVGLLTLALDLVSRHMRTQRCQHDGSDLLHLRFTETAGGDRGRAYTDTAGDGRRQIIVGHSV